LAGRDVLDEGLDVRTLELDPGGYAALDILGRADVMGHLSDWRAGSALGMKDAAFGETSSALAMITVPRADPMWYVRGGSAMERFWLTAEMHGLSVQPTHQFFSYAVDESDMLVMAGERYLDEMHMQSERFHHFWGSATARRPSWSFGSSRRPRLGAQRATSTESVLSRDKTETISPIEPYSVEKR